ncbi:hypothetical protein TSUD_125110 [Trifolium subterraneum]|uniref:Uncharacterized protein n=1 Tax=Trifolium subterraneum TaxID=3900 RepID=A0A2Z6M8U3_TRISU|nr:hypothetical protein TSUD_125110 [Trifolium subterraneum]
MGMAMIEPLATQYVVDDEDREENLYYATKVEELRHFNYDLQNERDLETTEDFAAEMEVQATSGHRLTSSHENDIDSNILGLETKMKQTEERDQDFIENVSDLKITSIANSEVLMNGQSTSQQCLMDQLGVIDTAVIPSQVNNVRNTA